MSGEQAFDLEGKTALVTGAARRIGARIVERLHEAGANVAIHCRGSAADAEALADGLNRVRPDSAATFEADLGPAESCEELVRSVIDWNNRLDVLVNNASSFFPTPLGTISEDDWDNLVDSNLKAPLFLAQAAWPYLQEASGNIINIVDIHARRPLKNYPVYVSAKAGLEMLTRSLAREMAPTVRVNGIAPGAILWPEDDMTEAVRSNILSQIPLGKTGNPDQIAECLLFLVRDATYTTGHVIAVDGGRGAGWG